MGKENEKTINFACSHLPIEKGELTLWVEWLMQRVQPPVSPVTIEQLLKELAHSTHVHRTQQMSKARQPPKEQGGGSLVLVRVAHFSSGLLAHAF